MVKSERGLRADPVRHGSSSADEAEAPRSRAQAVSELFREHNRTLVRFLEARLRDEQEAREVAQEAYVRLLELERTGAVSFLRAYLFRIALNIAIDRIRSRNTQQRIRETVLGPVEDLIEQAFVENHVFAADEMKVLWSSLDELPSIYRQAFVMSRLENLSTAEIARRLTKSDRMVRRYIVHALIYCRRRIDGISPEQARECINDK